MEKHETYRMDVEATMGIDLSVPTRAGVDVEHDTVEKILAAVERGDEAEAAKLRAAAGLDLGESRIGRGWDGMKPSLQTHEVLRAVQDGHNTVAKMVAYLDHESAQKVAKKLRADGLLRTSGRAAWRSGPMPYVYHLTTEGERYLMEWSRSGQRVS